MTDALVSVALILAVLAVPAILFRSVFVQWRRYFRVGHGVRKVLRWVERLPED